MIALWIFTNAAAAAQRLHGWPVNENTDPFSRSSAVLTSMPYFRSWVNEREKRRELTSLRWENPYAKLSILPDEVASIEQIDLLWKTRTDVYEEREPSFCSPDAPNTSASVTDTVWPKGDQTRSEGTARSSPEN